MGFGNYGHALMMRLIEILRLLEKRKLHYSLSRQRDDSVMISVTMVGLRVEIDVFEDDHIEYSVFSGDESVLSDFADLKQLLDDHSG